MGVAPVSFPSAFSLASLPGSDGSLKKISSYFDNAFTLWQPMPPEIVFTSIFKVPCNTTLYTCFGEQQQ